MQPLPELVNGLRILEPFLTKYGFRFHSYENDKGSGGQFTNATYINKEKSFLIGYRYSIGFAAYQYGNSIVSHSFYLDSLGHNTSKQFPGFQSDDKLSGFNHLLHDFEFLIADFFEGNCESLKKFAPLQKEYFERVKSKLQEESENRFDLARIHEARQFLKEKKYLDSLKEYQSVEKKNLLTEFDIKSIKYCEKRLS